MRKRSALLAVCFLVFLVSAATFFVSGAQAQNSSGANNAELNGNYAFTFNGFTGSGGSSAVFAAVGRFTADGAGNLTNGELDSNGIGAGAVLNAQPFSGTYTIGADNRGTMTLNIAGGTAQLAFAMTVSGNAQFIEFDAGGGSGTIGSGTMEKADTAAFSTARITGDYAFGLSGFDASNNRLAFAGRLTADGAGNFTNGAGDGNVAGTVGSTTFSPSSYTISDTANGRGTMGLSFSFQGTQATINFVFYMVNSGKLFAMETDALGGTVPLLSGSVVQQQTPAGGFSNPSLNGGVVLSLTGRNSCGGGAVAPDLIAGLLVADGNGGFSLNFDENCGGTAMSNTGLSGTSAVAANGRVAISIGSSNQIAYLISANQIFFLGTDSSVFFGPGDAQAAGSFNNASVSGHYAGFATNPATFGVTTFSGEFTADGASPTGNLWGAMDVASANGLASGQPFSATYSVSSSPVNGRGTVTITSGVGGSALAYVISPSKFVVLPTSDANPAIWLFEQAPGSTTPPPPTVSVSSLTLNPTTVVGGSQSSTGTVTLSAAAPAGGAQVALSSSDSGAAQVPASVTVPAGSTSARFTVSTSAVTLATSVTISASLDGVTQTGSLTVTPPPPPPPPTVVSLTLNPSSVLGGPIVGSSTGTVTLSGPAPSGGAQVALSSSNSGVASLPSSVTVPAGSTKASFTVNTSIVLFSTNVTISASYIGTTKAANLAVNAALGILRVPLL